MYWTIIKNPLQMKMIEKFPVSRYEFFCYSGFSGKIKYKVTPKNFSSPHCGIAKKRKKYWFLKLKLSFLQNHLVEFFHQGLK